MERVAGVTHTDFNKEALENLPEKCVQEQEE